MKKIMKRMLSLLLVLIITVSLTATTVHAGVFDKVKDKVKDIVNDKVKVAVEDTKVGTKGAIDSAEDMSNADASSQTEYNVFVKEYGSFTKTENVKDKELPAKVYDKLKKELKSLGISNYWCDHILEQIIGAEDGDIAAAIVDKLPGSFLYGDKVEKKSIK